MSWAQLLIKNFLMEMDFNKLIKNFSRVKLKGGIFGKTCTVLIVVSFTMFGISYVTKNVWISGAAIGLIFILSFIMLWRLINFANKNPQAAILEGAEFLIHEQMQLAAKGVPNLPQTLTLFMEEKPVEIEEEKLKSLNQPDDITGESEVKNG
jgi:hypothetical protein